MTPLEHQHGGQARAHFERLGLEPGEILDFSVNLNPLGAPPKVKLNWPKLFDRVTAYPSSEGKGVSHYYELDFELDSAYCLPLNGSIEGLYLLPGLRGWKRALIPQPSFFDYQAACEQAGVEVVNIQLDAANQFQFPKLEEHLKGVDAVILGMPNNPTGIGPSKSEILDLAQRYPNIDFVIDQAFFQFLPDPETANLIGDLAKSRNLWVLHSLTKFYSIPGLRLGALLSHPDNLQALRQKLPPWRINSLADAVAPMLANGTEYAKQTRAYIQGENQRFQKALEAAPSITLYPSEANFFLAQSKVSLNEVLISAMQKGIYLRDARNFTGLEDNFFRFCILHPEENDRLIEFLKAL